MLSGFHNNFVRFDFGKNVFTEHFHQFVGSQISQIVKRLDTFAGQRQDHVLIQSVNGFQLLVNTQHLALFGKFFIALGNKVFGTFLKLGGNVFVKTFDFGQFVQRNQRNLVNG